MISICIPTWEFHGKGVEYLSDLLSSISKQTIDDYEIVISDESADHEIETFVTSHPLLPKIVYRRFTKNPLLSHSANVNRTLELARGDYIKIMFADDFFYHEDALHVMKEACNTWVAAATYHINDECSSPKDLFIPRIKPDMFLGAPTNVMMKRNTARFDENLVWMMDMNFYDKVKAIFGLPTILRTPLLINRVSKYRVSAFVTQDQIKKELEYLKNQSVSTPQAVMP